MGRQRLEHGTRKIDMVSDPWGNSRYSHSKGGGWRKPVTDVIEDPPTCSSNLRGSPSRAHARMGRVEDSRVS